MKTKKISWLLFVLLTIVPMTMNAQIEFVKFRIGNPFPLSQIFKVSYKITAEKPVKKWYLSVLPLNELGDPLVKDKREVAIMGPFKENKIKTKRYEISLESRSCWAYKDLYPYKLRIVYMDNTEETINIRKENFKKFFPNNEWNDDYKDEVLNDNPPSSTSPISVKQESEVTKTTTQQQVSPIVISEIDTNIPIVDVSNTKTFAVIFANENYQEVANVEYALNDGESFKKYCKSVLGIPEKNIHLRNNATKNNMIAELAWMSGVADAYNGVAKFIVYYAGHGIPNEKSNEAYLLPVDGLVTNPATAYSLGDFYKELSSLNAAHVTVFIDACFSGSQRGDGMLASARGVVITPRKETPAGNMVVFSAAQGDETAYPYKEKGHGLFTYYLLKKLRDTKGDCTLQELGDYIQTNVKRQSIVVNRKSQTPSVSASQQLATSWTTMKLR